MPMCVMAPIGCKLVGVAQPRWVRSVLPCDLSFGLCYRAEGRLVKRSRADRLNRLDPRQKRERAAPRAQPLSPFGIRQEPRWSWNGIAVVQRLLDLFERVGSAFEERHDLRGQGLAFGAVRREMAAELRERLAEHFQLFRTCKTMVRHGRPPSKRLKPFTTSLAALSQPACQSNKPLLQAGAMRHLKAPETHPGVGV